MKLTIKIDVDSESRYTVRAISSDGMASTVMGVKAENLEWFKANGHEIVSIINQDRGRS